MVEQISSALYKIVIICAFLFICFVPILFYKNNDLIEKCSILFVTESNDVVSFNNSKST